ncbi:hypothetical protein DASC09_015240 [Saccharomycopsis crataegensis]|uniref:Uncharacterized protein n=1 Tax=Saccharomycopsis crataegensis TaxID=43959 RepID=A0AAV5QIH3_9ASCO|nr:hypothetical protein DASC09_015240 [Saccharomycopsis crataegensis]
MSGGSYALPTTSTVTPRPSELTQQGMVDSGTTSKIQNKFTGGQSLDNGRTAALYGSNSVSDCSSISQAGELDTGIFGADVDNDKNKAWSDAGPAESHYKPLFPFFHSFNFFRKASSRYNHAKRSRREAPDSFRIVGCCGSNTDSNSTMGFVNDKQRGVGNYISMSFSKKFKMVTKRLTKRKSEAKSKPKTSESPSFNEVATNNIASVTRCKPSNNEFSALNTNDPVMGSSIERANTPRNNIWKRHYSHSPQSTWTPSSPSSQMESNLFDAVSISSNSPNTTIRNSPAKTKRTTPRNSMGLLLGCDEEDSYMNDHSIGNSVDHKVVNNTEIDRYADPLFGIGRDDDLTNASHMAIHRENTLHHSRLINNNPLAGNEVATRSLLQQDNQRSYSPLNDRAGRFVSSDNTEVGITGAERPLSQYTQGDHINGEFTAISTESIEQIIQHIFNIPSQGMTNSNGGNQISSIYFEMTIDIIDVDNDFNEDTNNGNNLYSNFENESSYEF